MLMSIVVFQAVMNYNREKKCGLTPTTVFWEGAISISSLLMGFIVDVVYDFMDIQASAIVGQAAEIFPVSPEGICFV